MTFQGWVCRLFGLEARAGEKLADLDKPDRQDVAIERLQKRQKRQEQRLRSLEASRDVMRRQHPE